jgi:hypothetical protein
LLAAAAVPMLAAPQVRAADATEPPAATTPAAAEAPAVAPPVAPVVAPVPAPEVTTPPPAGPASAAPPSIAGDPSPAGFAAPYPAARLASVGGGPASAPEAKRPKFGHHGQVVLTQGFGFVGQSGDTTTIVLSPALDFFVANGFSLGFAVSLQRTITTSKTGSGEAAKSNVTSSGDYGSELHIGFNVNFSSAVSMWPYLTSGVVADGGGLETWVGTYNMPLLVHPAAHFFVGFGPELLLARSLKGSNTAIARSESFGSLIGGWW